MPIVSNNKRPTGSLSNKHVNHKNIEIECILPASSNNIISISQQICKNLSKIFQRQSFDESTSEILTVH